MTMQKQASLLGLPGELRNQIYGYVAADIYHVQIRPGISVPRIINYEDQKRPSNKTAWYTRAAVIQCGPYDSIITCHTDHGMLTQYMNSSVLDRRMSDRPSSRSIPRRHPLLQTCRQLGEEFGSVLQSVCPEQLEVVVENFDFSQLLYQLEQYDHGSKAQDEIEESPQSCDIAIHLAKPTASLERIRQNLGFFAIHFQQPTDPNATRLDETKLYTTEDDDDLDISPSSGRTLHKNGITYKLYLRTDYAWHSKADYIKSIEHYATIEHALESVFDPGECYHPGMEWIHGPMGEHMTDCRAFLVEFDEDYEDDNASMRGMIERVKRTLDEDREKDLAAIVEGMPMLRI